MKVGPLVSRTRFPGTLNTGTPGV